MLKVLLKRLGLNEDDKGMKVSEWNSLRKAMGKPRRFSQALINQELDQLNTYRERARIWVTKKQLINDGLFPKELTLSIQNLTPMQVVACMFIQRAKLCWQFIQARLCFTEVRS